VSPTTDNTRQANVAGSIVSFTADPSKDGEPGFWPISSDASLTGLSLSSGTLSPVFDVDTTSYTVRVANSVTDITATPTLRSESASIAQYVGATGTTLYTGALGGRETVIRVVVTAENGTKKTYTVTVSRVTFTPQNVTFTPARVLLATTTSYALAATASSGLNVTFASTTPEVCAVSGTTLTPVKAGSCVITASQAGDDTYSSASINRSIDIIRVAQTITSFAPTNMTALSSAQTLSASKGPGSAPVVFSTNSTGVCSITGTSLTVVASGTCVITATQDGDGTYEATPAVTKQIRISVGVPIITFTPVTSLSAATPTYELVATSGIGTVTFASTTPSFCTVSGTTLTPVKGGSCKITASQAGNGTYGAAKDVLRSITITRASQAELTVSNSNASAFAKGTNVTLTSAGGSGTGNTATFTVRGIGCSVSSGVLTVATTTRPGRSVSCSVTATRAATDIYLRAISVAKVFVFQTP
jgi:hypothetical protein